MRQTPSYLPSRWFSITILCLFLAGSTLVATWSRGTVACDLTDRLCRGTFLEINRVITCWDSHYTDIMLLDGVATPITSKELRAKAERDDAALFGATLVCVPSYHGLWAQTSTHYTSRLRIWCHWPSPQYFSPMVPEGETLDLLRTAYLDHLAHTSDFLRPVIAESLTLRTGALSSYGTVTVAGPRHILWLGYALDVATIAALAALIWLLIPLRRTATQAPP